VSTATWGRREHEPRTAATSNSTTVESSGHDDGDEEHPLQPQRASALLQLRTTAMRVRHQLQALSFRRADGEHPPGEYDEKAGLHACSCTSPHFNDKWPGPACSTCTSTAATLGTRRSAATLRLQRSTARDRGGAPPAARQRQDILQ